MIDLFRSIEYMRCDGFEPTLVEMSEYFYQEVLQESVQGVFKSTEIAPIIFGVPFKVDKDFPKGLRYIIEA